MKKIMLSIVALILVATISYCQDQQAVEHILQYECTDQVVNLYDTLIEVKAFIYEKDLQSSDSLLIVTTDRKSVQQKVFIPRSKVQVKTTKSLGDDDKQAAMLREKLKFHKYYLDGKDVVTQVSLGIYNLAELSSIELYIIPNKKVKEKDK